MADFTYDLTADWARYQGNIRVFDGQLKIAFFDAVDQLGLDNLVCNYRFGQNQSLHNEIGVSSDGVMETQSDGTLVFRENGVQSMRGDGTTPSDYANYAAVKVGGTLSNYSLLVTDGTLFPQVNESTVSFWISGTDVAGLDTYSFHTIFGFDFVHGTLDETYGYINQDDQAVFRLGVAKTYDYNTGALKTYIAITDNNAPMYEMWGYYGAEWPVWAMDNRMHHVTVHSFWTSDTTYPQYARVYLRIYVDGRYAGTATDLYAYGGASNYHYLVRPFVMAPHDGMGLAPDILASAMSNIPDYGPPPEEGWGTRYLAAPYAGVVDDLAIAHDAPDPLVNTTDLKADPVTWAVGDQILPPVHRLPRVDDEPYVSNDFLAIGPVEDAGRSAAINTITATLTNWTPALNTGFVHVDLRATNRWSVFYAFDDGTEMVNVFTGQPPAIDGTIEVAADGHFGSGGSFSGTAAAHETVPVGNSGTLVAWVQTFDPTLVTEGGTNWALLGTATQVSTDYGGPPERAIDGNTNGDWGGGSVSHTGYAYNPWWQVDLGDVRPIDHVNLWNRTDSGCGYRVSQYYLLVSDVPFVSDNLTDILAQPGVWSEYHAEQAGSPTTISVKRTGRYVRIQTTLTDYLNIAEVQVMATTNYGWNGASGILALGSSTDANGGTASIYWRDDYHLAADIKASNGTTYTLAATTAASLNAWHHVALTWEPVTGAVLWVDGTVVATQVLAAVNTGSNTLYTAEALTVANHRFSGNMDDVGYLPQKLTNAAIQALAATDTYHVKATGDTWHGHVQVSVRASDTTFNSGASSPNWSEWYTLENGVNEPVGSPAKGRYVQARLRMFPDADDTCVGVDRMDLTLSPVGGPYQACGSATLACRIASGYKADQACRMLVWRRGTTDVPSRMFVYFRGVPEDLPCNLHVKNTASVPARMFVKGHDDLRARIYVIPNIGHGDLPCDMNVIRHDADLPCRMDIYHTYYWNVACRINIPLHAAACRMLVFKRGTHDVPCHMYVPPEAPSAVQNLRGSLPSGTWQRSSNLTMAWDSATFVTYPVTRYYYQFSTIKPARPSMHWNYTTDRTLDLAMDLSGKWYFAVAAMNSLGILGQMTLYEVWYNHAPGTPGVSFMKVNGQDTIGLHPLIPMRPTNPNTFSWSVSSESDVGDQTLYTLQIATRSDFGPIPSTGQSSLVTTVQNFTGNTQIWTGIPQSGLYFWRIQANDGKESSDWSPVGAFVVNEPPGKPTGLAAYQE